MAASSGRPAKACVLLAQDSYCHAMFLRVAVSRTSACVPCASQRAVCSCFECCAPKSAATHTCACAARGLWVPPVQRAVAAAMEGEQHAPRLMCTLNDEALPRQFLESAVLPQALLLGDG